MTINQRVDLNNCDREPIHIPGSIQPHGCLLACDQSFRTVIRHSANAGAMLGLADDINGKLLDDLLGEDTVHSIRNALARSNEAGRAALSFALPLRSGQMFDIAVHNFKATIIVELEPAKSDLAQPLELARTMLGRIAAIDKVDRLIRDTARLVQAMLGYDRVMVYQFEADGAGRVVSEAKRGDLESFFGQYFPSSDIPQQARALYLRNTVRIISDADAARVPIVPEFDASGEPLDLSFAHLRSVSPIHCEYLRNMGVAASMSISIIIDGQLWGLIACHHYQPRTLPMAKRVAAEMFGQFFSLHLSALKRKQKLEAATRARQALDRFLQLTAGAPDIDAVMRDNLPEFASLVPSDGTAIWLRGRWYPLGATPPEPDIGGLLSLAETVADGHIWATHKLSNYVLDSEGYADVASGALIVPLSQRPRDYLFFFRKEIVQTLDWAGNPEKSYETGPLGDRLTPRKSFAIWKETVRRQSVPWTDEEREIAEATRMVLIEIVLRQNELLEEERSKSDVRQRMLNEELNHRVKNILAIIKSLVNRPDREGVSIESYVSSLQGRIQALAHAHDQVVRGDGGGALADLISAELSPYRASQSSIVIEGPPVWLDTRAFSVMALMLHELSTNAAKYGALSRAGGKLSVTWTLDEMAGCRIEWIERGGPPVVPPARTGFGTVLIDRSVPFDLGGESDLVFRPEGLQGRFRIPAKFVSTRAAAPRISEHPPAVVGAPVRTRDFGNTRVLIIEDQMLIAMHLEQILADAGVKEVITTASVAEALQSLRTAQPDVAVLDVNLGGETSEALAHELKRRGVPFMFATGYGDTMIPAHKFPRAPVVQKPYEAGTIIGQIGRLLNPA